MSVYYEWAVEQVAAIDSPVNEKGEQHLVNGTEEESDD